MKIKKTFRLFLFNIVNQRISRRKNSSNAANSKTATSEADKIAARLATKSNLQVLIILLKFIISK